MARPGDKPGGISTDVTEITATVEDIDTAKRIVKLKGPEGKIRVLKSARTSRTSPPSRKGINWWFAIPRRSPSTSRNSRDQRDGTRCGWRSGYLQGARDRAKGTSNGSDPSMGMPGLRAVPHPWSDPCRFNRALCTLWRVWHGPPGTPHAPPHRNSHVVVFERSLGKMDGCGINKWRNFESRSLGCLCCYQRSNEACVHQGSEDQRMNRILNGTVVSMTLAASLGCRRLWSFQR